MKKKILLILAVFIIVFFFFFGRAVKSGISFLYQYLFQKNIELRKEKGATNVLLLGIGGGAHDGPDLSDTMIFANINLEKNEVNLISIPRDLWVPDIKSKINAGYAYGEEKGGKGIVLSKAIVEKILGQPVNYTLVGDFAGFEKAVDLLEGIDVDVKRSFDDYEYPIEGKETDPCGHAEEELSDLATASSQLDAFPCRYKHIHFERGLQKMNGARALTYVRSRHALGPEGSDFARSQRQQQIILAFKNKIFSLGTVFNPVKILGMYNIISDNIHTDIKTSEFDDFAKLVQDMKSAKIKSYVLDFGDLNEGRKGLLTNPDSFEAYGNQWVLIPRAGNGNFDEIKKYVQCIVDGNECTVETSSIRIVTPSPKK